MTRNIPSNVAQNRETLGGLILLALLFFIAGSLWLYLRRWDFNIHIANKVLSSMSLIFIGLSLTKGISFRNRPTPNVFYIYSGLFGFYICTVHVLCSVFVLPLILPDTFSYSNYYLSHIPSFAVSTISFIILCMLFISSCKSRLGQYTYNIIYPHFKWATRLVFIGGTIHSTLLKYPGWIKWMTNHDQPFLPPLSLIVFIVCIIIGASLIYSSLKQTAIHPSG